MNDKQQAFVNYYVQCWNATEAAINAGYSEKTAYSQGSRLLKDVEISEAIQVRITELSMQADEALIRLGKQARGSMADFVNVYGGMPVLDWEKAKKHGALDLVKKISIKEGEISFELYDSQSALKEILKQLHLSANEPTENSKLTFELVYPKDATNPTD